MIHWCRDHRAQDAPRQSTPDNRAHPKEGEGSNKHWRGEHARRIRKWHVGLAGFGLAGVLAAAGAGAAWAGPAGPPGPTGPSTSPTGPSGPTGPSTSPTGPSGPTGPSTGPTGPSSPAGGPSPCAGAAAPPSLSGCGTESLLYYADSSGMPTVVPGHSTTMYWVDETPYAAGVVQILGPHGQVAETITPTVTPVAASSMLNYSQLTAFDHNGGSPAPFNGTACPSTSNGHTSAPSGDCEYTLSFDVSSANLTPGKTYTARITVYDYDGNYDQISLPYTSPSSPVTTPIGAVGGAMLAVAMGGGLAYIQRRRHWRARRAGTAAG